MDESSETRLSICAMAVGISAHSLMDRARRFGRRGWGFESLWARKSSGSFDLSKGSEIFMSR